MAELVSIAYVRPAEGNEQQALEILADLYTLLRKKNYSRDLLYRDAKDHRRLINLRYWRSEEARQEAQEDPEVHRLWQSLSEVSKVEGVIEKLELVEGAWSAGAR
ncbi:MAG: antibiotic biosynthesis monooxygenase [Terriglobales bacterium]|jgi:quinol monooxygenase YgiN